MSDNGDGGKSPRRLLAVDDSRLVLRVIEDFFRPHGYDVITALTGKDALEKIRAHPPDVIVADILMPEPDGWELYRLVREDPATAEIPFLFLTTETELPKRLRGLHMGADDYLTKPFAVEELHARVERALRDRARRGTSSDGDVLLAGSAEHLSISDLLQILALNGKDGIVVLQRDDGEGRIYFESGRMIHAVCDGITGRKALFRMLTWKRASFRVLARKEKPEEQTLSGETTSLLMDGLVSVDEWRRWSEELPDRSSVPRVARDARSRMQSDDVTPAELDVLARIRKGASIGRVLEESTLADADVAEAICRLVRRGVLRAPG